MSLAGIRRRCATQIDSLELRDPVSVETICERIAILRGRPIRILAQKLPSAGPCGLRIATRNVDYLVVQENAPPAHQDFILLHELGHVLFDPDTGSPLDQNLLEALVPQVDPATVTCMLGRGHYALEYEQMAEVFATMLWGQIDRHLSGPPRVFAPNTNEIVDRVERTLEQGH
jgi:hypothetical protein